MWSLDQQSDMAPVFLSPLPNPKLWAPQTLGHLQNQDTFEHGGWWHDSRLLAATGEGVQIESKRAWKGWWNEQIVNPLTWLINPFQLDANRQRCR